MTSKLLIIKLGGSVITFKDDPEPKVREETIESLAQEIKELSESGYKIIIVHGAGSFGHPPVKKYQLHKGMQTQEQKQAFSLVISELMRLNSILINKFVEALLPVASLPPHSFVTQDSGKFTGFDTETIEDYLSSTHIPVLFGDLVMDRSWGCSVLSGDVIVPYLAQKLKAEKVIYLSDVDGIFDKDPKKYPDAKLIKDVNDQNLEEVLKGLTSNNPNDVTGEMEGKILEIKKYFSGLPVVITNGLVPKNLTKAVDQYPAGTTLQFD